MTSNSARKSLPWTPPSFPATTVENDGTSVNRYDVRKTLNIQPSSINVNNLFMLWFITTEDGNKYHLTTNIGLKDADLVGSFVSLNSLQDMSSQGGTIIIPGSGNTEQLDVRSDVQSIKGPADGDRWTNTHFSLDLSGVKLDANLRPTGGNFYYGGGGGIQLVETGSSHVAPGWSWYWANPFTRMEGTLTVGGNAARIDTAQSFALFERQWGDFGIGAGYYALWAYLETGEVLISWSMEPGIDGFAKTAFASVWHPSGLHEMIPVGSRSHASDVSTSEATGIKYFNKFLLDLPARDANFTFDKWIRDSEIIPTLPEQRDKYITISESYSEGIGQWNGKEVRFFGHIEQLSRLR